MKDTDVLIVGAGQAGVSLSYHLQARGIRHLVVERDRPFASWHNRWDGFVANTPNWMDTLPMLASYPGRVDRPNAFPTRAELLRYFEACHDVANPPVVTGNVDRIAMGDGQCWEVHTSSSTYRARAVAVCTGAMSAPRMPSVAAEVPSDVPQIHSSAYRSPEQIQSRTVLVVGTGSSGVQILQLLCESGRFDRVSAAVSKVLVLPSRILGVPTHRCIGSVGLFDVRKDSRIGAWMHSGLETRGDPIMRRLKPKRLRRKYGVRLHGRFTGAEDGVLKFGDGSHLPADDLTVVWCTGFRPAYEFIDVPDRDAVFEPTGQPRHVRGVVDAAPGLYFVGLRYQHTVASHDIYGVGRDAEFVANQIDERLRSDAKAPARA